MYIILISCIILNAMIGVIFKMFNKWDIDNLQAIVVNYFVCVLTATVVQGYFPIPSNLFSLPWFWVSVGLGFVFILVFNFMAMAVQHFGVMIATIFQKMSLIAPTLIAILFYGETSNPIKWLGILASLASIILISYEKSSKPESKINTSVWLFPILTFLGSCVIDSALFLVQTNELVDGGDIGFVTTLFLSAGLNGLVILLIQLLRGKSVMAWKNVAAGFLLGVPNFFSIYLLLLALQIGWEGSVVFPVNNVGVLILAAGFGIFFFKESLTKTKLSGFVLAVLAILLIAFA